MTQDKRIGITTTIPVEVVYASGHIPVDLNNLFVSSPDAEAMVETAERAGFPRTSCSWVKGIYGAVHRLGIRQVIGVVRGDCSNTEALLSVLLSEGLEVFPFSYPFPPDARLLRSETERLMAYLGADWPGVREWKTRLDKVRVRVQELDELTWQAGIFTGFENHYYCVSCSDFTGNPMAFETKVQSLIDERLKESETSGQRTNRIRLGLVGVPPIISDLYAYLDRLGVAVVFNETQRQFAMPEAKNDVIEQYLAYTYPYGIEARIADIQRQASRRGLRGIIHYVQSFCHHQIEDAVLRKGVAMPVLTLEADRPGPLDARSRTRIEAFLETFDAR
jgi:benzoyl-CoA reductase/2-hydroxyglutaryl-CoA dehydratase subunit BcrC/BadD/HgdB